MNAITIPKNLIKNDDLVIISRKEYEEFHQWKKAAKTFTPTAVQKRDLARARKNRAQGNFLTINELKRKLGFTS